MSLNKLFEEVSVIHFDQWKDNLIKQIEENIDENGTGIVTIKSFYDPSWERSFNFSKGKYILDKDIILKDGKKPTRKNWKEYKSFAIDEDFEWTSDFIQEYLKKKSIKEIISLLHNAGWQMKVIENDILFKKQDALSLKLTEIVDETMEEAGLPLIWRH